MSFEKTWVEEFDILDNDGEMAISFELNAEPTAEAGLVYDGKNCAILLRGDDAYIFTNIVLPAREKLFNAPEVMMIETENGEVVNSYMCAVSKVEEIPCEDTIPEALAEMLEDIKTAYGDDGCAALAKHFWGIG